MTAYASPPDRDLAKILTILRDLKPFEVEALNRFYAQRQDAARIAMAVGMHLNQFKELKSRVRQRYLALQRPN